jgi:hypothetical protein
VGLNNKQSNRRPAMKTTLKEIRNCMYNGLMIPNETVGLKVQVGFLELTVVGYVETPGDYLPNVWILERGGKIYRFTPYNGLELAQ